MGSCSARARAASATIERTRHAKLEGFGLRGDFVTRRDLWPACGDSVTRRGLRPACGTSIDSTTYPGGQRLTRIGWARRGGHRRRDLGAGGLLGQRPVGDRDLGLRRGRRLARWHRGELLGQRLDPLVEILSRLDGIDTLRAREPRSLIGHACELPPFGATWRGGETHGFTVRGGRA